MNTNKMTLLVSFRGVTGKIITQIEGLAQVIKLNNKHGIDSIKEFDNVKDKFVRLSKDRLTNWVNYNTDALITLKNTGYIK